MATYNKKDLFNHLEQIKPIGFKQLETGLFQMIEQERILEINISVGEYYPHSAIISGVSIAIKFNEVENLLSELKRTTDFPTQLEQIRQNTIGRSLKGVNGVDYSLLKITDVKDNASFNVIKPHFTIIDKCSFAILRRFFRTTRSI
ncbi:hypothetical protein [Flagellimonas onchidii]|uniref:hypothetical protein n=1 Tax=Flagellimonas onchidii TaxID=2562684 RepID=UPI0010A66961|nr:hypothetical protein [Allomuricauda onchidii]